MSNCSGCDKPLDEAYTCCLRCGLEQDSLSPIIQQSIYSPNISYSVAQYSPSKRFEHLIDIYNSDVSIKLPIGLYRTIQLIEPKPTYSTVQTVMKCSFYKRYLIFAPFVHHKLTGERVVSISETDKSRLLRMFIDFVRRFYKAKARRNLLNLNYLLSKFLIDIGLTKQSKYIKQLKADRFIEHERIYRIVQT